MREARRTITAPDALEALAHPVRLDVLVHLMSFGPATASGCARAVGDSPSNCSYHLRVLARHRLVEPEESPDGRERPWRATVTGFDTADEPTAGPRQRQRAAAAAATSLQRDQRLAREYLARRPRVAERWRGVDAMSTYGLRMTPDELADVAARIDAVVRPYIAATREDVPDDAEPVHLSINAFPTPDRSAGR